MSQRQECTESDEELVARVRSGDSSAFDLLVVRYRERIYRFALRFSQDPRDAEEILQEVFLLLFRKLDLFRGESKFSTWVYRIAANAALMQRRSNARHRAESLESFMPRFRDDGRLERLDLDYGRAARADEILERGELAQKALESVARLPETYQATFVLRDLEEFSTEETAQLLGLEPGVVRTRLHRARLMIRGFLGEMTGGES